LENTWEEFKSQIQEEQSVFFDLYEDTMRAICSDLVKSLPGSEVKFLWLYTDEYFDFDGYGFAWLDEMCDAVENEIYREVCNIAANEELTSEQVEDDENEEHNHTE
jgi:hypothetical protein